MTQKHGKLLFLITLIFLFFAGDFVGAATSDKKEKKKEVITEKKTENEPVLEGVHYSDIPESPSEEVNYVNGKREGKIIMRYQGRQSSRG